MSDCLREINALKDQNVDINSKLVKANETIADMSNKIHCFDNDKLDELRAEIKDLRTDRDYLHSLLQHRNRGVRPRIKHIQCKY